MKTLAWICIAMLIFLSAYLYDKNSSLEQDNRALRAAIKILNERLDSSTELNNDLNEELDRYIGVNNESKPPWVHNTKKRLAVGDEFPLQSPITAQQGVSRKTTIKGSINTGDDLQDLFDDKETVVTFEPGGSSTRGKYTYSSPTGATIHVDDNGNITQIQGIVYRQ